MPEPQTLPLDGAAPQQTPPAQQLAAWLRSLVRGHQNGVLAELRRPNALDTQAAMIAMNFAGRDADDAMRDIYRRTAFLFAVYHRGATRNQALPGLGNLGAGCSRIGTAAGRGRNDPGAVRVMKRILGSRKVPWRHLQHAVERMRSCDTAAPNWAQLADDLTRWTSKDAGISTNWSRAFFTPTYTPRTATEGTR
ncbi:type I-E CRISPR-associated protein Cse2/CasB [Streptomyces sp. NPDC055105]|uniref:type I-E CRISPR-associated protein Cse2/CasB n=1 Tax=Streptomyces sp. NPDC055105 TaxID=3365719 RepID=UPI0037D266EE